MWQNKYIGIPFEDRGRTINGVDCWGLVRLIYKNEFNITLPSFAEDYSNTDETNKLEELISIHKEGWTQTTAPKSGAVVLFKLLGSESHVGVVVNERQFIHVSEGSTSVIESFDSILWKKRIIGFYEYTPATNSVLNTIPHPLKTERYTLPIKPGTTLAELHTFVVDQWKIAPELKTYANILVNGRPITQDNWATYKLKDTDMVEYRTLPGKDVARLALFVALVFYAPQIAGALEAGFTAGASGGLIGASMVDTWLAGGIGGSFTTMAVTVVGGALINAIAPIRPPTMKDPGQTEAQYILNGGNNRANPYGAIPVVLGTVRMTPALGAQNYATFLNERDSYLTMLLAWGFGPLHIDPTTYKIGEVALNLGTANQSYVFAKFDAPDQAQDMFITLDRKDDAADSANITKFNTIYSSDVYQNLVNTTLAGARDAQNNAYSPLQSPQAATSTVRELVWNSIEQNWGEEEDTVINAIPAGPWISAANNGDSVNTVVVDIHFPQGLSRVNTKTGDREPAPVNLAVEYSTDGGTTWTSLVDPYTTYTGGKSNGGLIGADSAKKDAFTISFEKNFPSGTSGIFTVRARRENGDNPDVVPDYRYSDTINFLSVTFYKTPTNGQVLVDPRNTKIAKTALRIKATDQINGQLDGINALVSTWLYKYNGTSWSYGTSNNPADLYRYVLQHPANPQVVTDSQLDLAQIEYWWNYCNTTRNITYTPTVGSQRSESYKFEYNGVIGETRSIMDVLRDICAAGRASPALINGKWSVTIDEPKSTVVQHFTPHNSWGFEGVRALPKLPDALRINFIDQDNNYQEAETIVYKTGKTASTAEVFESISLPGVTKAALVVDHAKWHMAQAYLRREVYTLNADLEYLVCNRGDRVKVLHDVPMWGLNSGRVKNRLTSDLFVLDEPISIDSTQSHTIRFRNNLGESNTRNVVKSFSISTANSTNNVITITTATTHSLSVGDTVTVSIPQLNYTHNSVVVSQVANDQLSFQYVQVANAVATTNVTGTVDLNTGSYGKVKVSSSTTTAEVDAGYLFLFGYLNQEAQDLIVISIEPTSNKTARLTLVDYGVTSTYNLFTDYQTLNTTNTVFETQITLPPTLNRLLYTSTQKPIITGISSDETAGDLINTTITEDRIKIAFAHPIDLPTNTAFIECEYAISSSTSDISNKTIRTPYPSNTLYINNVLKNDVYKIRLRYVSNTGVVSLWTDYTNHTVVGRVRRISNVANLSYDLNELNVELTWDLATDVDYDRTELRYVLGLAPGGTESTQAKNLLWDNSTLIGYSKTNNYNWIKPASNNYRVLAKHISTSGTYSIVPRIANIEWTNLIVASITSDLSNPVPLVAKDANNDPILADTGTTITVKQGGTTLKYDGVGTANGRWKITSKTNSTGIVSGAISSVQNPTTGDDYATIADLSAFTAEAYATVTYVIEGTTTFGTHFTITEIHKYYLVGAGAPGLSSALVYAYKRSATQPTDNPGPVTFSFTTLQIDTSQDALDNGWSKEIYNDDLGHPLWVVVATAKSSGTTDAIGSNEWSDPVKYVVDGINSGQLVLYKRTTTASLTTATAPIGSLKFTFATSAIDKWNANDTLSTILNGWSTTIPDSTNGGYLWAIYASAANSAPTDEILYTQWTAPAILAQDGLSGQSVDIVFQRSATQPSTPTDTTNPPTGWYSNVSQVPAGAGVIWSSVGYSTTTNGTTTWAWEVPIQVEGGDGYSYAEISVYTRAASGATIPTPAGGNYNFGTLALTVPTSSGYTWYATVADVPSTADAYANPMWISTTIASAPGGGTDSSLTWTSPRVYIKDGKAATVTVNVATGAAGSSASVSNNGTSTDADLLITIPRGDKGEKGDKPVLGIDYTVTNGTNGVSVYTGTIYRQNAANPAGSPPTSPSGGSYDFATNVLTPPSGWTISQPDTTSLPTWACDYTFYGSGTVTANTWGTVYADAVQGADGSTYIYIEVYKQAAAQPPAPTGGTWNFSLNLLLAPTNGSGDVSGTNWSPNQPAVSTTPTWMSYVRASTTDITQTVNLSGWSTPVAVSQKGEKPILNTDYTVAQSVTAYYLVASASLPAAPAVGSGDPQSGNAVVDGGWYNSPPTSVSAGQWLFQKSGTYNGSAYTWQSPAFLATFKVGQLTALGAQIGTFTSTDTGVGETVISGDTITIKSYSGGQYVTRVIIGRID